MPLPIDFVAVSRALTPAGAAQRVDPARPRTSAARYPEGSGAGAAVALAGMVACAPAGRAACPRPRWPCASVPYPPGTGM